MGFLNVLLELLITRQDHGLFPFIRRRKGESEKEEIADEKDILEEEEEEAAPIRLLASFNVFH